MVICMKKKSALFFALLCTLVSCFEQELVSPESDLSHNMFEASIESTANSKVFLNEENLVLWSEDDCLAIFRTSTLPTKYRIDNASAGQTNGKFTLAENGNDDIHSGAELPCNLAFYPYSDNLSIAGTVFDEPVESYTINGVVLPELQFYAKDSFAEGAFLMAAVTRSSMDRNLSFKNVLGSLKLQLTGTQLVKSIKLKGANGEKLSGSATVAVYADNLPPTIEMTNDASTEITLDCGAGVQLDETDPANFIFALPPVQFENGFTAIVTDSNGMTYELSTEKSQSITRSAILRMPPVSVNNEVLSPEKVSISVYEVGANYVDLAVQTNQPCELAYVITTEQTEMTPYEIFRSGTVLDVEETTLVKIEDELSNSTSYHLYVAVKLNDTEYSEVKHFEFTTSDVEFTNLLTVVNTQYDGYQMRITLPESTKAAGNAIRWKQCCIMMYNYMMQQGNDDYSLLLYNGQSFTTEDATLIYSEEQNWYQTGEDSDGDGEIDMDTQWNPISPGEPVVFVAGEFRWMEDTPEYKNDYFYFPGGWPDGYYLPMIDVDMYMSLIRNNYVELNGTDLISPVDAAWTGAFQRKFFRTKVPGSLDNNVDVQCVDASPVNLTFELYPEEGVEQYAFGVFDDNTYQNQVLPLLNGNPELMQWAVTSYFAAYTFGTKAASGPVRAELTTFYYQDAIKENTDYHVFVTAMGDQAGTTQSFRQYTFSTTAKVLDEPVVEVTPVKNETTPFKAAFNIKCTTYQGNPLVQAYYASNYVRDWELAVNEGLTYFNILKGGDKFTDAELEQINSEEGLTVYVPSIDGEATRFAVLGYNEEYTHNDISGFQYIEDCPAVATVTTPFYSDYSIENIPWINPSVFDSFLGEWTATATLHNGTTGTRYVHQSQVTLVNNLEDYPSSLPMEVYELYERFGWEMDEVDAYYSKFKEHAEIYAEKRLANMNRILGLGWMDDDSYDRLTLRNPYDLFVAEDYNAFDVSSIYNDFGPKWYLEAYEDPETFEVRFRIPVDQNFLPPAAAWSVPFYLAALDPETDQGFTDPDVDGELYFPVEYDEVNDVVTIKPFVYNDVTYYPNIIGYDDNYLGGLILENPVVSEIVLTRGSATAAVSMSSAPKVRGGNVSVKANIPTAVYKHRTKIVASEPMKTIEMHVMTKDQIKARADEFVRMKLGLE